MTNKKRMVWVTIRHHDEGKPPTLTLMPEIAANLLQAALASPVRREGGALSSVASAKFGPVFEVAQVGEDQSDEEIPSPSSFVFSGFLM